MNWSIPRDTLIPTCPDFKNYGHHDKITRNDRGKILVKNNYTCRYCGGYYPKYLICSYLESIKGHDVCCRICYLITHLNYGFFNEIKLYYSEMAQLEIIKKTVTYVINNNKVPSPIDIDPNVKSLPISLLEFINILNNHINYPDAFKNYKFFFGSKMNLDFIYENYCNMFTYDDKNEGIDTAKLSEEIGDFCMTEKQKTELEEHNPTDEEKQMFSILIN